MSECPEEEFTMTRLLRNRERLPSSFSAKIDSRSTWPTDGRTDGRGRANGGKGGLKNCALERPPLFLPVHIGGNDLPPASSTANVELFLEEPSHLDSKLRVGPDLLLLVSYTEAFFQDRPCSIC